MQKNTTENKCTQTAPTMTKRIRTTNYIIGIHFSTTSKENVSDKVLRLIKNDITAQQTPKNQNNQPRKLKGVS